ncbi:hypothetical protein SAMN05216358_0136 [Rhizobium sp. AN5]|uniref:hypothetical protein n=1 Tax=Rhizobium sp. AN5 TaxID=1855304 RepID=UPI000BCEC3A5|nr:hypothetical protein [Rhizobium sp. AN5]SOC90112.1 hypothetical protein SAMN05216358_0136 [Rhizobium sp. AN5]
MALSPELKKMVSSAKNKYSSNNQKTVKPKDGRNAYRVLAPTSAQASWVPPSGQYWADLGVHWIKADKNGKPLAVVGDCDTVYQQPSVLNTAIEMAINSAMDEESKELYNEWKAKKSVLLNVVDRSSGEDPVVLELTSTTFGKVMDLINVYDDAGKDITDPLSGVDIIITKTGKGLNTKYEVMVDPAPPKPVAPDVLGRTTDLHEFIAQNFFRGEEQKALNCIAQIAGVAVPALTGPATAAGVRTPTAALSSSAAAVADASTASAPAAAQTAAAPVETAAAPVVDPAIEARKAEILRRQQEAAAELAALETPAPAPAETAAPASGISSLPVSEQDAILAELDNLV